ncbi:hypothetical protein OUZ56_025111 [Daphnia magna]|uniref:Uncharacterized protein n=1 Tax=Daphnia magna TaxID=35525 RepID=A0ABQ9ZIW8_9CRUS|nr:hypothetical protein OUZ56_025111 [Daphnia magna]
MNFPTHFQQNCQDNFERLQHMPTADTMPNLTTHFMMTYLIMNDVGFLSLLLLSLAPVTPFYESRPESYSDLVKIHPHPPILQHMFA